MKCPHCNFTGHRMDLHAHLLQQHAGEIKIYIDDAIGKMVYEMGCPLCGDRVRQPLRKRPEQLENHEREIRMVAFDLLLYHLAEKHPESG